MEWAQLSAIYRTAWYLRRDQAQRDFIWNEGDNGRGNMRAFEEIMDSLCIIITITTTIITIIVISIIFIVAMKSIYTNHMYIHINGLNPGLHLPPLVKCRSQYIMKRKIENFTIGLWWIQSEIMPDPPVKYLKNWRCDEINHIFYCTLATFIHHTEYYII